MKALFASLALLVGCYVSPIEPESNGVREFDVGPGCHTLLAYCEPGAEVGRWGCSVSEGLADGDIVYQRPTTIDVDRNVYGLECRVCGLGGKATLTLECVK